MDFLLLEKFGSAYYVASIKNIDKDHIFIKRFLKSKIKLKHNAKDIKFYRVSNNKHYFLFKTNLF